MLKKVNVRFNINPKLYTFLCEFEIKKNDYVIVETSLGQGFAIVDSIEDFNEKEDTSFKSILRIANKQDIIQNENNKLKEKLVIEETKKLSKQFNLIMDVVNAEYSFDGSKVLIDFISDDRVDFRDLVKDLASKLKTRIELRQISARDQAKMVGGIGICGRTCCCSTFLNNFNKVSIKMAKVQNLSLNPTKISGACGRLMCCLEYENDYYSKIYSLLPKLNSIIKTIDGDGVVVYTNPLKQIISVKIENKDGISTIKDFNFEQLNIKLPVEDKINYEKNQNNNLKSNSNLLEIENNNINNDIVEINSKKNNKASNKLINKNNIKNNVNEDSNNLKNKKNNKKHFYKKFNKNKETKN